MDVHISLADRGDLSRRIYRQILDGILDGRMRRGERLPSSRDLARRLNVSRNTVAVAYEQLNAEGFTVSQIGAGTFVANPAIGNAHPRTARSGSDVQPRARWQTITPTVSIKPVAAEFDFSVGVPDGSRFPHQTWRRLVARELRASPLLSAQYGSPSGHPNLRAAIARHVGISRSIFASAEDVLITQGAQQALDLIGRILIDPGDLVAVEEPGYPPARALFASMGARIVGIPVDGQGLVVDAIPSGVRLVYATPSHQLPLGTPMSLTRRTALLDWAEQHDALVIEDDYDSEFRYDDRPLEPLQSLDRNGRVIYAGTFSKTLLPSLRVGFLVAPLSLQPALCHAKQLTDWHGDLTTQATLAAFMDDGLLTRHLRKMHRVYADRHAQLTDSLQRHLGDILRLIPSAAGLHLCACLSSDVQIDMKRAMKHAPDAGVALLPLTAFCAETPVLEGVVIGFGATEAVKIDAGIQRLAACLRAAT